MSTRSTPRAFRCAIAFGLLAPLTSLTYPRVFPPSTFELDEESVEKMLNGEKILDG